MTDYRDPDQHGRARRRRRAGLPALLAGLALALGTAGSAAADTQPSIPGYNQAVIDRAIAAVTKTTNDLTRAIHPRRQHPHRHR